MPGSFPLQCLCLHCGLFSESRVLLILVQMSVPLRECPYNPFSVGFHLPPLFSSTCLTSLLDCVLHDDRGIIISQDLPPCLVHSSYSINIYWTNKTLISEGCCFWCIHRRRKPELHILLSASGISFAIDMAYVCCKRNSNINPASRKSVMNEMCVHLRILTIYFEDNGWHGCFSNSSVTSSVMFMV